MPADSSSAESGRTPLSPEAQAAALWTFVKAKAPRFTLAQALGIIQRLELDPGEDPRALAKRLATALQSSGIKLKHTAALQAASRLGGYSSWHTNEQADAPRLLLETIDLDHGIQRREFRSWPEVVPEMRAWADRMVANDALSLRAFKLTIRSSSLQLTIPTETGKSFPKDWAVLGVGPLTDDPNWLDGAHMAIEKFRRHLEESVTAVLDGYAVFQKCATASDLGDPLLQIATVDAATSELVLALEKDGQKVEVARGDELTTWRMLEGLEIALPTDGTTGWLANGGRLVWSCETLKGGKFAPERHSATLRPRECEQFFRRYRLAKRIRSDGFAHADASKHLDYLSGPPEFYRVDPYVLHLHLQRAGLTWESYFSKYNEAFVPMSTKVSPDFLLKFFKRVTGVVASDVFTKPSLYESHRVKEAAMLHALVPRVDSIGYALPTGVSQSVSDRVQTLMAEFSQSLQLRKNQIAHGTYDASWGTMLSANSATTLLQRISELGLATYTAADPTVQYITHFISESLDGAWVFGWELYFHFVKQEPVASEP